MSTGSCAFTGGTVLDLAGGREWDWLLTRDGRIAAFGTDDDRPRAGRAVELDGAVLMPAFADAHVHLPATGLYDLGLDLRGEKSAAAILAAFRERAGSGGLLFGGNFEDPLDRPLDASALDTAVGDRPALLMRADMHSGIVSSALLRSLDLGGLEGVDRGEGGAPTGYLREEAVAGAWRWFDSNLPPETTTAAIRGAARLAYSKGVTEVHEMHVVEWRGWDTLEVLLEVAAEVALKVVPYIADDDVERIHRMGFSRAGGDYFLDGSFGSHTAWMSDGYLTPPPRGTPPHGISYRDPDELFEVFSTAQRLGMQMGVHAIGDGAIEQAIGTWERVAADAGGGAVAGLGHRIEHFECAGDDHIERAAVLGLRASVQPAFDLYWGGPGSLYAGRIGWERARRMNRFKTMLRRGLLVAPGSDSTVTPLDPLVGIRALVEHHVPEERLDARTALRLYTEGARSAALPVGSSTPEAGGEADLVALSHDPLSEHPADIEVVGTWVAGERVWPEGAAERG